MPRSRPPRDPDDPRLDKASLGLDNYEKGKSFEQKVADLFSLLGYQTLLDYKVDDMQFDLRLELSMGIPIHALVECKNTERATQEHVRDFASKVDSAVIADGLTYQAILVAGNGFANNAHVMAKKRRVQLRTYEELLRSLVDLRPNLDAAVRSFQGTPLERLYVEQEVVLDGEIRPGEDVPRKGLTEAVLGWLEQPAGNFLALLGDFGCGKTSFSKRLASQLALQAREEMGKGTGTTRIPVLIDLREGGSSTVTLESLLTQHFQRLSSQPFNPQALLQLNREGYLVLLFDGFDETITYTEPSRYVENLRQILRAAEGKAKVLMTCRTHYFRDRPEVLNRLGKAPAGATTPGATRLMQEIQERPGAEVGINSVAWSRDGRCVATGANDGGIGIWDVASGRLLNTISGHENPVNSVCWSPDGTRLASGSDDKTVRIWEAATGLLLNTLIGHTHSIFSVAWSTEGTRLASGSSDKTLKLWEAATGLLLNTLIGHTHSIFSVAWSPEGTRLASGSEDMTVKLWDAASGRLLNTLSGHDHPVYSVSWSPEGTCLASGDDDKRVNLWDAVSGRLLNTLIGHDSSVLIVAWSPEGRRLASGSYETVTLWDTASGRLIRTFTGHDNWVNSVSWSPDGTRLATGSFQKVKVWDAISGQLINTLKVHNDWVNSVSWSPEGTRLATGSDDKAAKLWDAASGRLLNTLGHDNSVFALAWSPDGTRLATGSSDTTVKLWDAASGRHLNTLSGHDNWVRSVSWSPDGTCLASGSDDKTVKVWEAATGRVLNTLADRDHLVLTVSWSPDGTRLAVGLQSGVVEIRDLSSAEPRLLARFYSLPGSGFIETLDGYVSGSPEALAAIRFRDNWALYDVTDVPERVSPERVEAALRRTEG